MEVKNWTYEEYPEYTNVPEGAGVIQTTGDEIGTYYSRDVIYAKHDTGNLRLQVLSPLTRNEPEKAWPCIIYMQGSAWMEQELYHNLGRISKLAERGYIIAVAEYRHSGIAGMPAQVRDCQNAIRYMRKYAKEWHVIPDQIFVAGTSSGGHTAVFSQILEEDPAENQYPGISSDVIGIVNYYGAVSLEQPDDFPTMPAIEEPGTPGYQLAMYAEDGDWKKLAKDNTALHYIDA